MKRFATRFPLLLALAGLVAACGGGPTDPSAGDMSGDAAELAALGDAAAGCHAIEAAGSTFSTFDITPDGPVPLRFFPLWDGGPAIVPGFQSDASVSLTIDGEDATPGLVVTTKLLDETPRGSGATHAATSHVFELAGSDGDSICEPGEDCFQTTDRTVLRPTGEPGLFGLHGLLALEVGHGRFASVDAHPPLVTDGEIQFAPAAFPSVASWVIHGNLCTGG